MVPMHYGMHLSKDINKDGPTQYEILKRMFLQYDGPTHYDDMQLS